MPATRYRGPPMMVCTGSSARTRGAELAGERGAGEPDRNAMDRLTADERRLLELLAGSANGVSETLLVTRFTFDKMVGLVHERLATATLERTFTAGKPVEVTRVRITDAGRRALAQKESSA
jgi:hypothetical protein